MVSLFLFFYHVVQMILKLNCSLQDTLKMAADDASVPEPQFHTSTATSETSPRSHRSSHADGLRKRSALKKLIKDNTKCDHSAIYSQISFICRRLAVSHEESRITMEQAMQLIFDAHDRLAHRGLPVETVSEEIHKRLDKLEGNDRSRFGIVMANTNSSVHLGRGVSKKQLPEHTGKEEDQEEILDGPADRYSESFWADVI
jgi:hypothetical protein